MAVCIFGALIACIYDYSVRRIPNLLVAFLFLLGGIRACVDAGMPGVGIFVLRVLIAIFCLFPLYRFGAFGAGDVKLFGVLAGFFPSLIQIKLFFFSMLVSAIFSIIKMITKHVGRKDKICLSGPILAGLLAYYGGLIR